MKNFRRSAMSFVLVLVMFGLVVPALPWPVTSAAGNSAPALFNTKGRCQVQESDKKVQVYKGQAVAWRAQQLLVKNKAFARVLNS